MTIFGRYYLTRSGLSLTDSDSPSIDHINHCANWLERYAEHKKRADRSITSYGLKHRVERWAGEYVTNGAFIQAAILLDYKYEQSSKREPRLNVYLYAKYFFPENDWKRIVPIGFTKWLFKWKKDRQNRFDDPALFDFACDTERDKEWNRRGKNVYSFFDHICWHNACDSAVDAFIRGWNLHSGKSITIEQLWNEADTGENKVNGIENENAGYVYLLKGGSYYKIGHSKKIDSRIRQLAIALPFDIEVVHHVYTQDRKSLERFWHQEFENKRLNGEWFGLSQDDIERFKEQLSF